MKSLVLEDKKVFELSAIEADWLRENHPLNFQNLQRMLREGTARIIEPEVISG